jgi:Spy/CpxP family protein refolding chaperone
MRTTSKTILLLTLVLAVAAPLSAADKKKKKPGKKAPVAVQVPKGIELSEEQKQKVAELNKKYAPQLVEARKKIGLSKEQRQARAEAFKKARADGKKGKEIREAANAAAKLTDDQKAAADKLRTLQGEIRKALMGVLTDEQKAGLRKGGAKKKGAKKK